MARLACKDIPDIEVLRLADRWRADVEAGFDRRWREIGPPWDPRPLLLGPPVPDVYDALCQTYPPTLAWRKICRLSRRGLLTSGGPPTQRWPTATGYAVLAARP